MRYGTVKQLIRRLLLMHRPCLRRHWTTMPGGQPGELHGERPPRVVRCAARSPQLGAMVGRGTAKANPRGDQRGYLQEKEMQWSQVAVNNIVPWHSLNNSLIEMQGNMSGEFKAYLPCWAESGRKVHCCGGIVVQ